VVAKHRRAPVEELVDPRLREFRREQWAQSGDGGRWYPGFERWKNARKAWIATHPTSAALGSGIERFRFELATQMQQYDANAKEWPS
jgi:hypothetical protein